MKKIGIALGLSLLLNVTVIPYLAWRLLAYAMMYDRNVSYCSELAYAVGYHRAKGDDMKTELDRYPTRLVVTNVGVDTMEAKIWPAERQYMRLDFRKESICDAYLFTKNE